MEVAAPGSAGGEGGERCRTVPEGFEPVPSAFPAVLACEKMRESQSACKELPSPSYRVPEHQALLWVCSSLGALQKHQG